MILAILIIASIGSATAQNFRLSGPNGNNLWSSAPEVVDGKQTGWNVITDTVVGEIEVLYHVSFFDGRYVIMDHPVYGRIEFSELKGSDDDEGAKTVCKKAYGKNKDGKVFSAEFYYSVKKKHQYDLLYVRLRSGKRFETNVTIPE